MQLRVEGLGGPVDGEDPDILRQVLVQLGQQHAFAGGLSRGLRQDEPAGNDVGRCMDALVCPARPIPTELLQVAEVVVGNGACSEQRQLQLGLHGALARVDLQAAEPAAIVAEHQGQPLLRSPLHLWDRVRKARNAPRRGRAGLPPSPQPARRLRQWSDTSLDAAHAASGRRWALSDPVGPLQRPT
eukprot:scaffold1019_cov255-Pinguiococcus_pyrenoidosus.AAC.9